MAGISLTKINNAVEKALQDMVDNVSLSSAYMARVIYPKYLEAQKDRWASDNSGGNFAGPEWPDLKNAKDKAYKQKKFAHFPGGGEKLMVRSGDLYNSIVEPGNANHQALFTESTMIINTTISYALYLDEGTSDMEMRTMSQFSDAWKMSILDDFASYVSGVGV